ncbi:MAG: phage tail protein, partial [Oscillospiraceae bacterium]
MSENFGLKIGLEGEKEFKKSLAEINNSFKVLGSEMKLVDSQFDKNDKSAEALTARNQVLNKEIEQQKQKIDTLRTALQNAAESFGENDRRTQSWQIQLNNAQAALNGMERELKDNNTALANADKGFDEAGDEAKNFSGAVKKAADTSEDADGKLSKLGDTAKKIGAALGAAAAVVGTACVAAGKKLWDMANDVGSAGDQIDKTSQKIGISAESYQKWGYVFERCGADVDNLQTGMKKLSTVITDAAGGSDSAAEKLSAVGLSIEDLNGKSQDEQLSLVIEALQGMESGAERTATANDLLGKSATDMAAVLNISAEETERLKQEAEDYGMVMSNEAVAASAAFEDSLTRLSHTAGGLKNRMVGELLPGITQITDGLADLLAGNDNAADELKNGVSSVIDAIKTLIPQAAKLVSSIAGAVLESAPDIIKALADGLLSAISKLTPSLAKIVTEIISALVKLLPKIVSTGAKILLSIIKGISDTIPQLIPQIVNVVVEIVKTLIDNLPLILDAALQLITGLAQGLLDSLPVLIEALPLIITGIVEFLVGSIPQIIETGIALFTSLVAALPDIITAIVEVIPQIIDEVIKAVIDSIPLIVDAGLKLFISLVEDLPNIITTIVAAIPKIISSVISAVIGSIPQLVSAGVQLFVSLIENLPTIIVEIVKAVPQIIEGIVDSFGSFFGTMAEVGGNLLKGLWQGISDAGAWLWNQISGFFGGIVDGIKNFFGIHSPSKLFANLGGFMAEGLGEGFGDEMKAVSKEMQNAIPSDFDLDMNGTVSGFNG